MDEAQLLDILRGRELGDQPRAFAVLWALWQERLERWARLYFPTTRLAHEDVSLNVAARVLRRLSNNPQQTLFGRDYGDGQCFVYLRKIYGWCWQEYREELSKRREVALPPEEELPPARPVEPTIPELAERARALLEEYRSHHGYWYVVRSYLGGETIAVIAASRNEPVKQAFRWRADLLNKLQHRLSGSN